jgi:ribonuclease HI
MSPRCPHYLLFSQSTGGPRTEDDSRTPQWRFVLEEANGDARLTAQDVEPHTPTNRLELLAVVRGLEALDHPSRVTLITGSRYVLRGIRRGLAEWRRHQWRWERFGRWVPVRDHDLWQRIDRALQFHQLRCRSWNIPDDACCDEFADSTSAAAVGAA